MSGNILVSDFCNDANPIVHMDSMTCCTDVVSLLPMLIMNKLILFLSGNDWFHRILFVDWET